jgi:hypothetical protein
MRSFVRPARWPLSSCVTLKELDCHLSAYKNDDWSDALARCARFESLAHTSKFALGAWLGLSQLHTLLDVDLSVVFSRCHRRRPAAPAHLRCYVWECGYVSGGRRVLEEGADSLLARVRDLRLHDWTNSAEKASDVAAVLR